MPPSLAIFDLDGTLADSFPWFLRTINDVADRFGFRRVMHEDVERLRHASTREILDFLEVPLWKLPRIARHARRLKAEAAADIEVFNGVETMLRTLVDNGVQLGGAVNVVNGTAQLVVSSLPAGATAVITATYQGDNNSLGSTSSSSASVLGERGLHVRHHGNKCLHRRYGSSGEL